MSRETLLTGYFGWTLTAQHMTADLKPYYAAFR